MPRVNPAVAPANTRVTRPRMVGVRLTTEEMRRVKGYAASEARTTASFSRLLLMQALKQYEDGTLATVETCSK